MTSAKSRGEMEQPLSRPEKMAERLPWAEVARYLGLDLPEFRRLSKSDPDFPQHRISERRVRYHREDLDEWLLRR